MDPWIFDGDISKDDLTCAISITVCRSEERTGLIGMNAAGRWHEYAILDRLRPAIARAEKEVELERVRQTYTVN